MSGRRAFLGRVAAALGVAALLPRAAAAETWVLVTLKSAGFVPLSVFTSNPEATWRELHAMGRALPEGLWYTVVQQGPPVGRWNTSRWESAWGTGAPGRTLRRAR